MLYTGSGNIPHHIYCWVDSSFVRKYAPKYTFEPCIWFGLHSKPGHSWGCHIMLECGAVYRGVPPHALAFDVAPDPMWSLLDSQIWDCYGDQFSVVRYDYLNGQRAEIRSNGLFGRYLFTAIPMNDGFTMEPTQSKEFMFIELDNGRLCIMPTNELRFHDKSFTEGDWPTNIKLNTTSWRVE
ncbi:MAG: hypothetical protein EBU66_10275 [Bacteroidetes bacterium]|nr:hypothetical protein [bacterium]NBP65027.1 hypothetical protein [Bacteroidota bacterium]